MAGGWAVREELDRQDTARRAEILDAAREAFEEFGFSETSVSQITGRVGLSRASFYVYFASKQEVLEVLAEQMRDRFLAAQTLDGVNADDVRQVFSVTVRASFDVVMEAHGFIQVLDNEALRNAEIRTTWSNVLDSAVQRSAVYIERAQARGLVDPVVSPRALATMGGGLNEQFAPLVLDGRMSWEEAVDSMTTIWLTLLRPTAEQAKGKL